MYEYSHEKAQEFLAASPGLISKHLGSKDNARGKPTFFTGTLAPGASLLLCSDGLTKKLPNQVIAGHLSQANPHTPAETITSLIGAAMASTSPDNDNIMAVLISPHPAT